MLVTTFAESDSFFQHNFYDSSCEDPAKFLPTKSLSDERLARRHCYVALYSLSHIKICSSRFRLFGGIVRYGYSEVELWLFAS